MGLVEMKTCEYLELLNLSTSYIVSDYDSLSTEIWYTRMRESQELLISTNVVGRFLPSRRPLGQIHASFLDFTVQKSHLWGTT